MESLSIKNSKLTTAKTPEHVGTEKIIFIIQSLISGGAEKFFTSLVNSLSRQGVQPVAIILSDYNPMLKDLDFSIKTYILKRNFRYDLFISKKIKRIILQENAKKIFCIGTFSFFLSKLMVLHYPGLKFFLSLHTTAPCSFKDHILDILYLKLLQKPDRVIFICNNQQEYYKKKYFFQSADSTVIYNGIEKDFYFSNPTEYDDVRLELNIPLKAKVILMVANLRVEKGHFYAVDALKILHGVYNNKAHILFVGGGPEAYKEKLQNYIAESGLTDYVHLVGEKSDVRPYLTAADIFALTSFSVETFSIAALEAMSFGLPCCLTDIGGATEMVEEHNTGLLCKAKDVSSIAESWNLLLSKEFDREYIRNFVSTKFSTENMVKHYLSLISS